MILLPNGTTYIDCKSPYLIYLITCNRCCLQYVEKTVQKLNKRFNWQRTGFHQPGKYGFCHIVSDYFHKGIYCNASYSAQLLEKLEGHGRTTNYALDISITSRRKQRERTWMLKLRTIYPYGLNDRLEDEYKKENTHVLVGNKFPHVPRITIDFLVEQSLKIITSFLLISFSLNWNTISLIVY